MYLKSFFLFLLLCFRTVNLIGQVPIIPTSQPAKPSAQSSKPKEKVLNGYHKNIVIKGEGMYTGYFQNGKREGKGILLYTNGNKYDGYWRGNKWNGYGIFSTSNWTLKAFFNNGGVEDSTKVDIEFANKDRYIGNIFCMLIQHGVDFYLHGSGQMKYADGNVYSGRWAGGKKWGTGTMTIYSANGKIYSRYTGEWREGRKEGYGYLETTSLFNYEGFFKNDEPVKYKQYTNFNGVEISSDINSITADKSQWFLQSFNEGAGIHQKLMAVGRNGWSITNCKGATMYFGSMAGLDKEGWGRCYDSSGLLMYNGLFKNDTPIEPFPMASYKNYLGRNRVRVSNVKIGVMTYEYYGMVKNGSIPDGIGVLTNGDVMFQGNFINGETSFGLGHYKTKIYDYYGEWKDNYNKSGLGIEKDNGIIYTGEFANNKKNGFGVSQVYGDKQQLEGLENAVRYVGNWKNGQRHGQGRCFDKNGKMIYEGNFENDLPTEKYPNR